MAKSSPVFRLVCAGCAKPFQAKVSHAKWCSSTCRQRHHRAAGKAGARSAEIEQTELVVVVRAELVKHQVQGTVDGLLALHLAKAVAAAERDDKVGPVDRLRSVLAAATGRVVAGSGAGSPKAAPVEDDGPDELDQIRIRRDSDRARAAAG